MKNLYNRTYSIVEGLQYYIYLTTNIHIRKLGENFNKTNLDSVLLSNSKVQSNYIFNIYENVSGVNSNTTISELGEILGKGRFYQNNTAFVKLSDTIPVGKTCTLYDKFENTSYNITSYTNSTTDCEIIISGDISNLTFSHNRFYIKYEGVSVRVLYQLNRTSLNINNYTDSEKELVNILLDEFSEYSNSSFTNTTNLITNYSGYTIYSPLLSIDTTDITNYNIILNIYNIIEYYNFIKMFYFGLKSKLELSLLDISRYNISDVVDYDLDDIDKIPHFNFNIKLFNSSYSDWKNFLLFKYKQFTYLYEFYRREGEIFVEYFYRAIEDGMRDITNVEYLNNISVTNDNRNSSFIYNRILKNTNQTNYNLTELDHILSYNTQQLYDRVIIPFQNNNLTISDSGNNITYKMGLFKDHMKWLINSETSPNYTSTQLLDLSITIPLNLYFSYSSSNVLDLRNTNIYQSLIQPKYYNKFELGVTTTFSLPPKYIMKYSNNHNTYSTSLLNMLDQTNFNIDYNMLNELLNIIQSMSGRTVSEYTTYCTTGGNLHNLIYQIFTQIGNDPISKITDNVLPTKYNGVNYVYQFIDMMRLYELIQSYIVKYNHKKYTSFENTFDNFKLDNVNNYSFIEFFTGYFKNNTTYFGLNSIIDYINNSDSIYHMLSTSLIFLLNSSRLDYNESITNAENNLLKEECLNNFQKTNSKSIISVRENVMGVVKQIVAEQ